MAKLFVSYSRRDSVAARKLIEAFRSIEQDVWVDWESIPPAVDWLEQIFRGIEEADAFLFLISPDSIASEVCKVEINRAAQNNKRIIPIVLRDVNPKDAPENISKLNWTFMRETDNFEEGLAKVKTAIELDLDWLEEHRRLQVRALEWHRRKDPSLLLHGRDLRNARHMVATATSKDPFPTDLQKTYLQHSLRNERNRNIALVSGGVALIIMAVLAYTASRESIRATQNERAAVSNAELAEQRAEEAEAARKQEEAERQRAEAAQAEEARQKQIAQQKEIEAEVQRSAARAQIYLTRPGELYTSTLLAIDSMRRAIALPERDELGRDPSAEAEEILRRNLSLLPLPVDQFAQTEAINALEFNPAGGTFITASADGSVCAWKVEEEHVSQAFCTPAGGPGVNAITFNHNQSNEFLVTGNQAGLIQILDPQTGEVQQEFQRIQSSASRVEIAQVTGENQQTELTPLEQPVRSISVRPTRGQSVVVTFDDGQIPVFDPVTGKLSSRLSSRGRPNVSGVSPNGSWLVVGSETGPVNSWNLGTGRPFSTSSHRGGVLSMAFSPTENKVVTAGSESIAVSNLSIEKELYRIVIQSPVRVIAFSPDGSWFATGSDDHRIRVWDTNTGNERVSMTQDGVVTDVVFSSNGRWIASTGDDQTARVWDVETGAEIFQIPLKDDGAQLGFINDDKWLVSTDRTGAIAIWDISIMTQPTLSLSSEGIVNHVQYSPSGEWLAVASEDKVWLLRPDPESIVSETRLGSELRDFNFNVAKLVFSPDSTLLGILTAENEVAVYHIEENTWQLVRVTERIQSIAFAPDNQQLITSDSNGNLQAWDALNAEQPLDVDGFPQGTSLASAGELLAVGSQDQIIILNQEGNGDLPAIESSGNNALLVFSPDGSLLASSSSGGKVTIFQYEDGQFTERSSFIKDQATSLAFNSTGTLLAMGTAKNAYLMDVAEGKEVARIPHISTVNGVSFSADGNYLATASSRDLQFWELSSIQQVKSDDLIAFACSFLYENFSDAQWEQFFAGEPYESLCKDLDRAK
jgi:WD40 repeat protein